MYKNTLKRIASLVLKYKFSFTFSLICAFLYTLSSLVIPLITGKAIDFVIAEGNVDFQSLLRMLSIIALLALLSFISSYLMARLNNRISYLVSRRMRDLSFSKLSKLPLSYLDSHQTGDTLSRIVSDIDNLSDGLILGFSQLFTGIMTILGTLILLFNLSWILASVVLLVTPLSFFVASFISSRTNRMYRRMAEDRARQTECIDEMVRMDDEVKIYHGKRKAEEIFDKINEDYAASSFKATFFSSITNPSTRFVNSVVYALTALTGALLAINGRISVGLMTSALSYANQYTKPFNEITGVIAEFQNAIVSASRVFSLLDEKEEETEGEVEISSSEGDVAFDDVSFSYNKDQKLIENFSFKALSGRHVAIVGPTGAGKTTIINLLMRFYDADKGRILLDGKDITSINRQSVRRLFGMVLQDTYIRNATVRENILMGRSFSDEDVIKAARLSHAEGFIERLPDGYDTVLSDESSALSQGERQLLSIARIMLSLPPILILDEATSSIDTRTELLIQNSFSHLMQGRTTFSVAHRLSTIENADTILVMKDGAVIEMGDHKELLARKGFYYELYRSQFA